MSDAEKAGGWKETLLGFAIILLFIVGAIAAIRVAYTKYFVPAPGVVSLSAYFVDDSGSAVSMDALNSAKSHIKVKGDISQGGQLVKNGSVRLTISSVNNGLFRQSVYIPFQNGHFETEDPAFRSVRPGEPIGIKAEVTTLGLNETATIYLNHKPPVEAPISTTVLGWGLFCVVLFLVVVFFVAFTGKKTAFKNRTAIIFSYLITAIFLAVPIVAPTILLQMFPGAVTAMIGKPAGLVNTHTPDEPKGETQWALNIGGYSVAAAAKPAENPSNAKQERDATTEKHAATQVESPTGAGPGAPGARGGTSSSSKNAPASKTAPTPVSTPGPSDEAASTANSSTPQANAGTPVVEVTGGLLIPLYVIILSVIGGAINMTRKVPGFQKEGEESDFPQAARKVGTLVNKPSMVGMAVINSLTRPATGSGGATTAPVTSGPVAPAAEAEKPEGSLDDEDQKSGDETTLAATPKPTPPAPAAEGEKPGASLDDQAQAIDDQLVPLVTLQLQRNGETDARLTQIQTLVSKMQGVYGSRQSTEPLLKWLSSSTRQPPRSSSRSRG